MAAKKWPKPQPFGPELPSLPVEVLPLPLREYVPAVAEAKQVSPDAVLMMCLTALSMASRNAYVMPVYGGDSGEQLSIYTLTLMGSGERKDPIVSEVLSPLKAFEASLRSEYQDKLPGMESMHRIAKRRLARLEKEADESADGDPAVHAEKCELARIAAKEEAAARVPKPPTLFTSSPTPEGLERAAAEQGGRIGAISTEGGLMANLSGRYNDGRANVDFINSAYTGSLPSRSDRAQSSRNIDRPFVAAGLALQPAIAAGMATRVFEGSGYLARFLYAYPQSMVGRRKSFMKVRPVPPSASQAWFNAVMEMVETADGRFSGQDWSTHEPREAIEVEKAALRILDRFADELEERLHAYSGDLAEFVEWGNKLPGNLVRIAGLFALLDGPRPNAKVKRAVPVDGVVVTRRHMESALMLSDYLIAHASAALTLMRRRDEATLEEVIWRGLVRKAARDGLTTGRAEVEWRWVHQTFKDNAQVRERVAAHRNSSPVSVLRGVLNQLHAKGYVRRRDRERAGRSAGRQPQPTIWLNPAWRRMAGVRDDR